MKLYSFPASTFARRVRVALLEKNIPCELIEVDLPGGKHQEEWYAALNPYTKVPTLVDGAVTLYESAAILAYLEATHPVPPLVPQDVRGRALVDMHVRLCDSQLGRYAGAILFPKRFLPEERWDRAAMGAARVEIAKHFLIIERELGERPYPRRQLIYACRCGLPALPAVSGDAGGAGWSAPQGLGRAGARPTQCARHGARKIGIEPQALGALDELHRHRIHAVAQAGGPRAIVENMAQMRIATGADHLGAHGTETGVGLLDYILLGNGLPETGPAGARVELGIRVIQRRGAADAAERAMTVLVIQRPGERTFGARMTRHIVGLGRQQRAPFGIGLDDLVHQHGSLAYPPHR